MPPMDQVFVPLTVPPPGLDGPGPATVISVRDREVWIQEPEDGQKALSSAGPRPIFLGTLDGRPCWAVETADEAPADPDAFFVDLRRLYGMVPELVWTVAGRAVQLVDWSRTHRYCGRCGTSTELAPGERAMRCPSCGLSAFPRLAPAIIVLVEREDGRALLARNVNFPGHLYSCVAGFVEPGESLEEAVRREVREEVGVDVGDVRYWGSQPWPFPHSLMLGFHASYAGGEVVCDPAEIADAKWFTPEEMPTVPSRMSIARKLIDDWLERSA